MVKLSSLNLSEMMVRVGIVFQKHPGGPRYLSTDAQFLYSQIFPPEADTYAKIFSIY